MTKIERIQEVNMNNWKNNDIFNDVFILKNKYRNIPGVNAVAEKLDNMKADYNREMNDIINNNNDTLLSMYWDLTKDIEKYFFWKTANNIVIVCNILFLMISENPVTFLLVLSLFVSFICRLYISVKTRIKQKRYFDFMRVHSTKSIQLKTKYSHRAEVYADEIDNLYLNSLDGVHRETILMRRDQARQHEELMARQRSIEEMRAEINRLQQKLVDIEEEHDRERKEREREQLSRY